MGDLGFVPWKVLTLRPRRLDQPTGLSIYALIDPRDMLIRYVGYTCKELHQRLAVHLERPVNKLMGRWFRSLAPDRPLIERICWTTEKRWERDEMYWIGWCRQLGVLLNSDPGGQYRFSLKAIDPERKRKAKDVVRNMLGQLGCEASKSSGKLPWHGLVGPKVS